MRFIYVAGAVGMAIAVLMGASVSYVDTGVNGHVRCIGGDVA